MKLMVVLAILALLNIASAETINFGTYKAEFTWEQPHETVLVNSSDAFGITTGHVGIFMVCMEPIDPQIALSDIYTVDSISINGNNYFVGREKLGKGYLFYNPSSFIMSSRNLTSTLDFLKTLKIEKRS